MKNKLNKEFSFHFRSHFIPDMPCFHPELVLVCSLIENREVCNDLYCKSSQIIRKICFDLYSGCTKVEFLHSIFDQYHLGSNT